VAAQKVKMKQSTKIIIASGSSCLLLIAGMFMYFNFSQLEESQAQVVPNIVQSEVKRSELEVPAPVIMQSKYMPEGSAQPNVRIQKPVSVSE
jgi:hypothetical protein